MNARRRCRRTRLRLVLLAGTCLSGTRARCKEPAHASTATHCASLCSGVERINTASCSELRNSSILRSIVQEVGLANHNLPDLQQAYGTAAQYVVNRSRTDGLWQDPLQLSIAMQYIGMLIERTLEGTRTSARYLEVGVFAGWTAAIMSSFVRRMCGHAAFQGFAVDINPQHISNSTKELFTATNITFIHAQDSSKLRSLIVDAPFDVCFVDGDHSFDGVLTDFVRYAPICDLMMFHDIADYRIMKNGFGGNGYGVPGFWQLLLNHTQPERIRQFFMRLGSPRARFFGIGVVSSDPLTGRVADELTTQWARHNRKLSSRQLVDGLCGTRNPLCPGDKMLSTALTPPLDGAGRPCTGGGAMSCSDG